MRGYTRGYTWVAMSRAGPCIIVVLLLFVNGPAELPALAKHYLAFLILSVSRSFIKSGARSLLSARVYFSH
jgi:hypothetical protein